MGGKRIRSISLAMSKLCISDMMLDNSSNMRKKPTLTKENELKKRKEHLRHSSSFQQSNQTLAGLNYLENSNELFGRLQIPPTSYPRQQYILAPAQELLNNASLLNTYHPSVSQIGLKYLAVLPEKSEEPISDEPVYYAQARSVIDSILRETNYTNDIFQAVRLSHVQVQRVMSIAEASRQLQAKSKEADNNVEEQDESFNRFMNVNSNEKHNLLHVEANECPISTNTDPVERHMTFTNMRNK